jgi:hypothetical protein
MVCLVTHKQTPEETVQKLSNPTKALRTNFDEVGKLVQTSVGVGTRDVERSAGDTQFSLDAAIRGMTAVLERAASKDTQVHVQQHDLGSY